MEKLILNGDEILELYNICDGVFHPLNGFMTAKDYRSVVDNMHLTNGSPWTIPVTLDIPQEKIEQTKKQKELLLVDNQGDELAVLFVEDILKVDHGKDILKVFGTNDTNHPGVLKEISRSVYRVGGRVEMRKEKKTFFSDHQLKPAETKEIFGQRGFRTVTGFQTRNPIHRAHEYLQRLALEVTDGLFIQPLIGWKKSGDISPSAIIASYEKMIRDYYDERRVVFAVLTTPMRYAGPREAVFHAVIRRNYGCTHFIVGRDHAGVGNYYGKYDAHKLCAQFNDLGIKILTFCGPYFCPKCAVVVTERTCPHGEDKSVNISGTKMREYLNTSQRPPKECMREDIADLLIELHKKKELFISI